MSLLLASIGLRLGNPEVVQFAGMMLMMPLMFMSSAFAPFDTMPDWLATTARANPVTHTIDASRSLVLGHVDYGAVGSSGGAHSGTRWVEGRTPRRSQGWAHRPVLVTVQPVKGNRTMIMLGIDAHKRTHTVVAVDELGRRLGTRTTTATTTADHLAIIRWADQFGNDRCWAVEDCRHLSRRLERDMLAAGEPFDPQPGDWFLVGDDEEPPCRARVTRRHSSHVWVQLELGLVASSGTSAAPGRQ